MTGFTVSGVLPVYSGSGQSNFIVMGHSQGGLIARDVNQRSNFPSPTGLTRGVVTLNCPHQGALLARNSRNAVADALADQIVELAARSRCPSCDGHPGCFIACFLAERAFRPVINYAFDAAIPASTDLIPGSSYLSQLNSAAENFTRVGIEGDADKRWALMRLGGDAFCFPENGLCGGRAIVRFTRISYGIFRFLEIICLLRLNFQCAAFWGGIADGMDNVDRFWTRLTTTSSDGTDGIVQTSSQVYPAATARYPILGADSHLGATKSDKERVRIEQALEQQFFVPRLGCNYSLSAGGASFSAQGGTGSFSVTAAAGCAWSAVSSDGWVTVTAGMTGSGSGTVSFRVEANFSPMPRSGSINVAGRTFTISQAGATSCIFVVSPADFSVISDGGSGTVNVTTQPGCIWFASSNADWISITSGATGTGSGAFSFSVGAHTGTTTRTGTVTVVDQVVTIRQDSPFSGCGRQRICDQP